MKKMILRMLATVIAFIALQSCATKLQLLSPSPRINIEPQKKTIALVIGDEIKDGFTIPAAAITGEIIATNWRQSLKNGFRKGFTPFFIITDSDPELTIKLLKTEVYFEKTGEEAMSGGISVNTPTQTIINMPTTLPTFTCRILYQAQLLSAKGDVLEKAFGTSSSSIFSSDIPVLAASSVENMYEQIARKFFPVK